MILKANENDILSIKELAHQSWAITYKDILSEEQIEYMLKKYYSIETLKETIVSTSQVFLVYKKDSEILGFISYELNYNKSEHLKIHKLYIHPNAQGLGLGKTLLNHVAQFGLENNQKEISLNVNKYNNSAILFYEKVGLRKVKDEVINIGNNFIMDDFVMGKSLI